MLKVKEDLVSVELMLREMRDNFTCQTFTTTFDDAIAENSAVGVVYMMQANSDEIDEAVAILSEKYDRYTFSPEGDNILVYMK